MSLNERKPKPPNPFKYYKPDRYVICLTNIQIKHNPNSQNNKDFKIDALMAAINMRQSSDECLIKRAQIN